MLIDVKPRSRQPRTRSAIDWSHPLTRALRFAYTIDSSRPYADLVSGRNGAATSGMSLKATRYGVGLNFAADADALNFGDGGIPHAGGNVTVMGRAHAGDLAKEQVLGDSQGASVKRIAWYLASTTGRLHIVFPGAIDVGSTLAAASGDWIDFGYAYTYASNVRFFLRNLTTGAVALETAVALTPPIVAVGDSRLGGNSYPGNKAINQLLTFHLWDRALSDQELLALSFEPYAFIKPVRPAEPWRGVLPSSNVIPLDVEFARSCTVEAEFAGAVDQTVEF